jgi:hypothetical protein
LDQRSNSGQKDFQLNLEAVQKRDKLSAIYLQQLQALAFEISVATNAIAGHALTALQDSVAKQEMLCASLATMAHAFGDGSSQREQALVPGTESAIDVKIRAARRAVRELNLQYAALLKHSGKSIALLISLCRSHTGRFQEARGPRLKHQTWSCEM